MESNQEGALVPRGTRAIVLSLVLNMSRQTSDLFFLAQERNWEGFRLKAEVHAKDLSWRDGNAWVVLQEACKYNPTCEAIQPILDNRPNIAGLSDPSYGRTSLHTACKFGASLELLRCLLKNSVSAAFVEATFLYNGFQGSRPVDYIFFFYARKPKETTHQFWRAMHRAKSVEDLNLIELKLFWKKLSLLYIAMEYGLDGIRETESREYNDPLIIFKTYSSAIKHGCCAMELELFLTKIFIDLVSRSGQKFNVSQRLLINLLVEGGVNFRDGLAKIVETAPDALTTRDPKTRLFPFILAATIPTVKEDEKIETVYKLLLCNPEAIRLALRPNHSSI